MKISEQEVIGFQSKNVDSIIEVTYTIWVWQGLENGNITFSDELDFDVSELKPIFDGLGKVGID